MKRTIPLLAALALPLSGCYVNYHHRYLTRLYRERHPLLIWIAMYGTPMRIDYPQENAMDRTLASYNDERFRRAMLQVAAHGTLSAYCAGCGLPLCPSPRNGRHKGVEPCCRDAKVIRP